jgi:hypothetical protein
MARKEILGINKNRIENNLLLKFLPFASREELQFLLKVLGYVGDRYSKESFKKVETRLKKYMEKITPVHTHILSLLKGDTEAFQEVLKAEKNGVNIYRIYNRCKQYQSRNLKTPPLKFIKSYLKRID